jgi:hypothetical protein
MLQESTSSLSVPSLKVTTSIDESQKISTSFYNMLLEMPAVQKQLSLFDTMEFNIFRLVEDSKGPSISILACYIMNSLEITTTLKLNPQKIWNFFRALERSYRSNAYHNSFHGADVVRFHDFSR